MTALFAVTLLICLPAAKGKARLALSERTTLQGSSAVRLGALRKGALLVRSESARPHPLRFLARHTNAVLRHKCLPTHSSRPRTWLQARTWHRQAHRAKRGTCKPATPWPSWWYHAILCVHNGESSDWYYGAPGHRGGNGYEGGLQFVPSTWTANGGLRFAAHAYYASPLEQIAVAWTLWKRAGWGQWPNTSRACGL